MTPTARPWRIEDAGRTVFGPSNGNPSPETIASVMKRANAAHIVHCVNTHDALVEALEKAVALLQVANIAGESTFKSKVVTDGRAVIAKAKGQTL